MILTPGGSKSPISRSINGEFARKRWQEKKFDVQFLIDGLARKAPTHEVDYFKNGVAVETEWNNKDPFYDRDLNNFRLLFDLGIVHVGVIITRATELDDILKKLSRSSTRYGASTTHMSKLLPKVEGGSAGGCPLLALGIRKNLYDPNS
jgi:hypothetical protein